MSYSMPKRPLYICGTHLQMSGNHILWCLLITFANSLNPDQDRLFDTLMVFLKHLDEKLGYLVKKFT